MITIGFRVSLRKRVRSNKRQVIKVYINGILYGIPKLERESNLSVICTIELDVN